MRVGPAPAADSSWWVDHYEVRVESIKLKARCAKEDAAKEAKQKEEAKELAVCIRVNGLDLVYQELDPKIQKWCSVEEFAKERQANPAVTEAEMLYQIELAEISQAKEIGGTLYGRSWGGPEVSKRPEVSLAGIAAALGALTHLHKQERKAHEVFQAKRAERLSPSESRIVVAAATILPALSLRQNGNPQHAKLYHEKEWREATGDKAKRLDSSTRMSQSAFETEGGATRKDLKAALDAFPKPKGTPGKDSS